MPTRRPVVVAQSVTPTCPRRNAILFITGHLRVRAVASGARFVVGDAWKHAGAARSNSRSGGKSGHPPLGAVAGARLKK